jgi:tricorn protease
LGGAGYYRWPTIHGPTVVFVCEDDLWSVAATGGPARRLTAGLGEASHPALSPDGRRLAFTGREEGHAEVYVMPAGGGVARRLTWLGGESTVVGWTPDGRSILFVSDADQPYIRVQRLYQVDEEGGLPRLMDWGPVSGAAFGPGGARVICRRGFDAARWKRYRGGRCGELWIDPKGTGSFRPLVKLNGNVTYPMWVGRRVFFLSDHEGYGNVYSCTAEGRDVRRHTDHDEFYARHPRTDGRRIVYHAGADLHLLDPAGGRSALIPVELQSPRVQRQRKFVEPDKYLESFDVHPEGTHLALTVRGRTATMAFWEDAVTFHGASDGVRTQMARWLPDGKRVVAVSDEGGENFLEVRAVDGAAQPVALRGLKIGRPIDLAVSPVADVVVLANERFELIAVDLKRRRSRVLDRSAHGRIAGIAWSPDGRWVAYGIQRTPHVWGLNMCAVATGRVHAVTQGILADLAPSFDPEGRYLYFISHRDFNPVYDSLHFDLNFPRGSRPCLVTLRKDLPSPFVPQPRRLEAEPSKEKDEAKKRKRPAPIKIDWDGIQDRVVAFPVEEGKYTQVEGIPGGALFVSFPVEGALPQSWMPTEPEPAGVLEKYDLAEQKHETLVRGISYFELSADRRTLVYRAGPKLRALKAGAKPPKRGEKPGRESGWIDLGRLKVSVDPGAEWRQMFAEAWRLMRDHFWVADMSGVDWAGVRERYGPLVDRVGSRSEFSDLMWETQGELGTSHCYELGGDYRPGPQYRQGMLAADFEFDARRGGYRITHVVRGDSWNPSADSPLNAPGLDVREGDVLRAVGGRPVSRTVSPHQLLVNMAGQEVRLTVARGGGKPRTICVKALEDDRPARYREWVERNRRAVRAATRGRVGYLHIPDMGPPGYAEFFRGYLAEVDREALIVDVRYNRGGHVSQLLLEKLARRRLGYDIKRYGPPEPYPGDSPSGPMVALTNEFAGSDGDIFSHSFKLMKLGPLVGKRTWGGVIGIWPRQPLVDGSITTQPEFSFWFRDVGWAVENYGTDPDEEVEVAPQDVAAGRDPQLARGIALALEALRQAPATPPRFGPRPNLAPPKLPPRP